MNRTLLSGYNFFFGFYPTDTGPDLPSNVNINLTHPPFNISEETNGNGAIPFNY